MTPPLRKQPALYRLPIVRVLERLGAVILFAVLVYILAYLISVIEIWRLRSLRSPISAEASVYRPISSRVVSVELPLNPGSHCRIVVVAIEGMGRVDSHLVCRGKSCIEPLLQFDRRGRVACTEARP